MTSIKILNAGILAANGVYKASQSGFTRIIRDQTFLVSKASIPGKEGRFLRAQKKSACWELGEDFQDCWAIQETSKTPITLYATTERSEFPPLNGWIPIAGKTIQIVNFDIECKTFWGITPPPILEVDVTPGRACARCKITPMLLWGFAKEGKRWWCTGVRKRACKTSRNAKNFLGKYI